MKTITALLLFLMPLAYAQEETYYYDEDEEFFNKGTFVGEDSGELQKAQKRAQMRNWGLAVVTTVAGAATLFLVRQNHK